MEHINEQIPLDAGQNTPSAQDELGACAPGEPEPEHLDPDNVEAYLSHLNLEKAYGIIDAPTLSRAQRLDIYFRAVNGSLKKIQATSSDTETEIG